jgi:hypothetical protein
VSNRSLLEFNHDYCPSLEEPGRDERLAVWARQITRYLRSLDKSELPPGVTFKHRRHHSEPDPMEGRGDPS